MPFEINNLKVGFTTNFCKKQKTKKQKKIKKKKNLGLSP